MSGVHATESRLPPGDREQRPSPEARGQKGRTLCAQCIYSGEGAPATTGEAGRLRRRPGPTLRGSPGMSSPPTAGRPLPWAGRGQTSTCPLGALVSPTPTLLSATVVTVLFWHDSFPQLFVAIHRRPSQPRGAHPGSACRDPEAAGARSPRLSGVPRPARVGGAPARETSSRPKAHPACAPPSCPSAEAFPPLGSSLAAGQGLPVPPSREPPRGFKFLVKVRPWVEGGKKEEEFTVGARVTISSTPRRLACKLD